jgi:glycosyltransferase involved in cell wall biosynthesis
LKIAYLINQYPKVSHSFIRREILAVEAWGVPVARFSVRSRGAELVDEADKIEQVKTRTLLDAGFKQLLPDFLQAVLSRPGKFLRALGFATRLGMKSGQSLVKHWAYLVEACVLLRWFAEAGITHVHAHFGTNSTTVAMLCHALGGPTYSFTVHGPEEFDKVEAIALPEKIDRAAFVVAISSFGKSQLYRWCPLAQWAKIHVIHCGVDESFLTHPITPIPAMPQLVCVGRLCEQKGQLLLVSAAAQLVAEGLKFKLVLVGDGELRGEIETLVAKHGLQDVVEITGWASGSEVRDRLLSARAMVLPSFAEGLPVVIMESLALHRPVITTYVAGIPELVEPEVCGWLMPAGSVAGLVEKMRSALQATVETLEKMGTLGAERVARDHTAAIEAKRLVTLFETVTAQQPNQSVSSLDSRTTQPL